MTRCSETKLSTKSYPYEGPFSKTYAKECCLKKLNTCGRILKELLALYERNSKFEAVLFRNQTIFPLH